MSDSIQTLVEKLEAAQRTYYNNTGELVLSDAEYDALEDQLRKADPNHPFFTRVGATPSTGWKKVKHEIPMGSLNKAQDSPQMSSWLSRVRCSSLMISEKLDGISIALRYRNRKLVQAVTRGDGETGEDITRNVRLMKGAVKMLPPTLKDGHKTPDVVHVRGEIICAKGDFAKHFPGESNPRNTASGTAKRQSGADKCRHLTIKAYQMLPEGYPLPTKGSEFTNLAHAGFRVPHFYVCDRRLPAIEKIYQEYIGDKRDKLDYDIDGLVVEVNEASERQVMGAHNGRPKWAIAFKFPHEEKPTVLRGIQWQVGNSGRITPVAVFDSIILGGANVRQASLHNVGNIARLLKESGTNMVRMTEGCRILVSKRNDVIPYVEAVLGDSDNPNAEVFETPVACPSCQGPLTGRGEYLVCRDEDCPAQAAGAVKRWVKKIGLLHVGDVLIETLIDAGMVEDPADLYTLNQAEVEDLEVNGRRLGGVAAKAIRNLEAQKTLPLHVLVGSLGIPMIGQTMAKTLVDAGFDTLSKMLKARISDVASVPGVGQAKAECFVTGFVKKAGLISKLLANGIQIQDTKGPLSGQSFCLTGFRDKALQAAIEKAGGTIKSSVSKSLTYLVAKDPSTTSGKAAKARKYKINIISPDDAWKLM